MKNNFKTAAITTLVLVYIVIIAGALVRMTGSGMGCPDWPKCFGYYIPPTDIKELTWSPNRDFEEGQVIIKDEALLVAKSDFNSGANFNPSQWRAYTKHDYAVFNPTHTWIEYLNRLAGALAGISTFVMAILSFRYWRSKRQLTVLSWLSVILMGFQGWLGATVVYSVLNPLKITLHMLVALLIVMVVTYIIFKVSDIKLTSGSDPFLSKLLFAALVISLLQILLGTQVRQFVDEQVKLLGYDNMGGVLENPTVSFYIHRSFSILVLLVNGYIYFRSRRSGVEINSIKWIMALVVGEIITGFVMYYFSFPFGFQTMHLVFAALLFGLQYFAWLRASETKLQAID